MKRILRFEGTFSSLYSNILHAQYQRKQYELVKAADATKTNVSAEWLAEWEKAIKVETEINMQASASVFTAKMREKDAERDMLLTNIFSVVRAQRTSPVSAIREAAQRLYVVFKPYFGIQDEIFEAESGHIIGMEQDAARYQTEITALGLKPVFDELHTANEAYEKMRTDRRTEGLEAKLPDARTARRNTDELFEGVCQCILASYILAKTDADKQTVANLVDAMNKTSADFKATHNASMAQKKSKDKKKPGKPDEKSGGSDGGNGKTPGGDKGSDGKGPNGGKTPDDGKGGKGNNDGKGKGGKKGGDDGNVSPEKALITPLLPALETELNLAHDCLAYGGVTDVQDGVTIYLIVNKRTQEEMYVKVEGGKLVVVEKK
ncbi:DUF6261 family protein [Hoylesella saccharolytica]|uniref:DUF6261 family protein n=1 Tax=Hoylesella saccharolytica TaxID=633701 RepID=UPI000472D5A2|nr:DUF6261 family protein [Hoylesella saccharolytica]